MVRKSFIVMSLFLVGGCQTAQLDRSKLQSEPATPAVRAAVANAARDFLLDPYSIRDAEISNVVTMNDAQKTQLVCVRFNSKNAMGGYTGRETAMVPLLGGKPVNYVRNAPACLDGSVRWVKFTEAEALRNL